MDRLYKREGPCVCLGGKVVQLVIESDSTPTRVSVPMLMCPHCSEIWHIENAADVTNDEVRLLQNQFAFVPNTFSYKSHPKFPEPVCNTNDEVFYLVECFSKSVLVTALKQFNEITNCGKATGAAKKVIYGLKKYFHSAKRNNVVRFLTQAVENYESYSGVSWDTQMDIYDNECRVYRRYLRAKADVQIPKLVLGDKIELKV